jgi:Cdc6-like AAA superfamily ATPase
MHELRAFASRGGVRRSIEKIVSLALYKELMASRYCDTNVNRDSETQRTLFKSASRGLISNILDDRALSLDQKAFVADNTIDLCMAAWNEAVSINKGSMSKNF